MTDKKKAKKRINHVRIRSRQQFLEYFGVTETPSKGSGEYALTQFLNRGDELTVHRVGDPYVSKDPDK